MTTFTNESTLRARFALFDEGNNGYLRAHELANVFRSLGWNDINTFHCNNLMQTHFGIGSQPLRLTRLSSTDNKKEETKEKDEEDKTREEKEEEADEDEEVSEQEELSSPVNSKPPVAEEEEEEEKEEKNTEDGEEELPLNDKPCDRIDVDQFLYLANLVTVPKNSPLECYKSFTIMDFTQSGILSEADLAECAMRIHGSTLSVKQRERLVKSVMTVADVNEDGLLSLPEYRGAAAKGGAGTEDGALDLAFFVVDQPPKPANTFVDSISGGRRVSGASSTTHNINNQLANNASFTSNRSRHSRRGSNAATTTNASYPHGNVVNTIPGFYDNDSGDQDGADVDDGEDEHHANGGLSTSPAPFEADTKEHKETFNFEGIDVTFTDGRISKEDVAAFFVSCGDLLTGEDFERWFAVEDDDEDGFLSEEQFRSTLEIFLGEGGDDNEVGEDMNEGDNFLVDA